MNSLDSRFLHVGNCYGRRFTSAGTFPYELSHLPLPPRDRGQRSSSMEIKVRDATGEQAGTQQHNVSVGECDGVLSAEPACVEIALGDTVLWVPDKSVTAGVCIRASDGQAFDSAWLASNSLYTHAFGRSGRYEWRDAHGSGLSGEVLVAMPKDGAQSEWLQALSKGTVIHVSDEEATPAKVEVVVGQTVFWAIAKAQGVSITDVTLLGSAGAEPRGVL